MYMKKSLKITLIIIGALIGFILLDTIQALVFNKNTIIGTETKCMRRDGIFVNTYHCENGKHITKIKKSNSSCNSESVCDIKNLNNIEEQNSDCCKGCLCGDTLELLKTIETAWTLTKINSNGEYEYDRHSFINFHGTGKNKYAFFKNNANANPISKETGELIINKQNEIILIPDNNKNSKITCKIGEEKDLIAVLNCDNNFGTFTLQKQGMLELPTIIKETIPKTKKITIKGKQNKTISNEKDINTFISIVNNSKVWTGAITLPSPLYEIELFDINDKSIAKISYNPNHYFNIKLSNKNYELTNIDKDLLSSILDNI